MVATDKLEYSVACPSSSCTATRTTTLAYILDIWSTSDVCSQIGSSRFMCLCQAQALI